MKGSSINPIKIESLKYLRKTLTESMAKIQQSWDSALMGNEHYLSEDLADLVLKLEETIESTNQFIGELTE